jgi:methylated-DNA-[protein]-cysteine S-methyltransferase
MQKKSDDRPTASSGNGVACHFAAFRIGGTELRLCLEATGVGLTACRLNPEDFKLTTGQPANPHIRQSLIQLSGYFEGTRGSFEVPLVPPGTDFQGMVWRAAGQIPYGQTRSYWWVAVRIGNPHAMRSVGSALGANPLPLFIPCHRVVRQDGALGGFTCGIEWKRLLIEHEAAYKDSLAGT